MEVGMREYPIDATTDGAQFGHRWLLDAYPRKTNHLVAVKNDVLNVSQSNGIMVIFTAIQSSRHDGSKGVKQLFV